MSGAEPQIAHHHALLPEGLAALLEAGEYQVVAQADNGADMPSLVSHGGYKLRLDRPSGRDRIVESEDRMILMQAPDIDQELAGVVLDLEGEDKLALRLVPAVDMS